MTPATGVQWCCCQLQGYRQRRRFLKLRAAVRLLQAAFRSHLGNSSQRNSRAHSAAECLLRFVVVFHGQSQLWLAVKHVQHAGETALPWRQTVPSDSCTASVVRPLFAATAHTVFSSHLAGQPEQLAVAQQRGRFYVLCLLQCLQCVAAQLHCDSYRVVKAAD
jgi:hypothetical protein